jgi:hypothetical protein
MKDQYGDARDSNQSVTEWWLEKTDFNYHLDPSGVNDSSQWQCTGG